LDALVEAADSPAERIFGCNSLIEVPP